MQALDVVNTRAGRHEYDVAFSFAGEDREIARRIAAFSRANGVRVYIDEHHQWESWGKDLTEYLAHIYDEAARYCVILVSEDYVRKPYTIHERRIALARALESRSEYVLPVRLDDAWPPGLPRTIKYLDAREMDPESIGEMLVRKVRGPAEGGPVEGEMAEGEMAEGGMAEPAESDPFTRELKAPDIRPSPVQPVDEAIDLPEVDDERAERPPLDFALVSIAAECQTWEEGDTYAKDTETWSDVAPRWTFRGGFGYYEDPILDVTIINRSPESRLLSSVGIVVVGASHAARLDLGGGGAEPVDLHRTYQLPLPDVRRLLAEAQRAACAVECPWVDLEGDSTCRLPDPILIEAGRASRYGLHLFDYTDYCPTEVELVLWARTDAGEVRSDRLRLSYLIGSDIQPLARYRRLLLGSDETEARRALGHGLVDDDLRGATQRPLS